MGKNKRIQLTMFLLILSVFSAGCVFACGGGGEGSAATTTETAPASTGVTFSEGTVSSSNAQPVSIPSTTLSIQFWGTALEIAMAIEAIGDVGTSGYQFGNFMGGVFKPVGWVWHIEKHSSRYLYGQYWGTPQSAADANKNSHVNKFIKKNITSTKFYKDSVENFNKIQAIKQRQREQGNYME